MKKLFVSALAICLLAACTKLPVDPELVHGAVHIPGDTVTFAIIGDYGNHSSSEGDVANMVASWNPDFIITVGDNNYPLGLVGTLQQNISDYYCDFIYNPDAPSTLQCHGYAAAQKQNRFFPAPGNHDNAATPALQPYTDFFSLPGDERNYEFSWGPVDFYSLNTGLFGDLDCCGDGTSAWLQQKAMQNSLPFKFVYFHHPPFSSGNHGSNTHMQWPFADWGIDAVLCGHDHLYERITELSNPKPLYLVCGNSGKELYHCTENPLEQGRFNQICDDSHFGAVKVRVNLHKAIFEYYTTTDQLNPADVYVIQK